MDDHRLKASSLSLKQISIWRYFVFFLVFFILSYFTYQFILAQLNIESFQIDFSLFTSPYFILALLLAVLHFAADALRLQSILQIMGHNIPFFLAIKLVFINVFFSNITPMATGGGVVQVAYLKRNNIAIGDATAATTIAALLAIFLIFLPVPFLLMAGGVIDKELLPENIAWLISFVAMAYLTFFVVVLFRTAWMALFIKVLCQNLLILPFFSSEFVDRLKYKMIKELVLFSRANKRYFANFSYQHLCSIFSTFLLLLSLFSIPYCLFEALAYHFSYTWVILTMLLITFTMYFSPTPGGAAVSEGLFAIVFASLLDASHLLLIILCWRLLSIYAAMFIGFIYFAKDFLLMSKST